MIAILSKWSAGNQLVTQELVIDMIAVIVNAMNVCTTWERSVSFKGNILSRERLGSRCYQRLSQVAISSFATRFSLNLNRCSS